ncbi:MAG: hypothetical protein AAF747_07350 [Planctomycetota bacterium]
MSALSRQLEAPFRALDWEPTVTQMLDENHLVAWSDRARHRVHFAAALTQFLGGLRDSEVCPFYGRHITDLESFCYQLERALPGVNLDRRIEGASGVTSLLRSRHTFRHRPASKFRYFIWHDADVLVREDHRLFGRLVDALVGVSAEQEYTSDELLILHRTIFVGGPLLDVYAEDNAGQFRAWYDDGQGEPFWSVVTGLETPPIETFSIDDMID